MSKEDKTLEKYKVYIGNTFNRLTIVDVKRDKNKGVVCKCKCSCNNEVRNKWVRCNDVVKGYIKSCGCLSKEVNGERISKYNKEIKPKTNRYDVSGEYGVGWTTNTNEPFYFDLEDYDKIKDYAWAGHKLKNGYNALQTHMKINGKKKTVGFHYLIGCKNYDHINRNPFDNRKSNLRECDKSQNSMNKTISKNNISGVSGVSYCNTHNVWKAYITCKGTRHNLGSFKNFDEAVKARLEAEKKYFKEFAPQKHLYKKYGIED